MIVPPPKAAGPSPEGVELLLKHFDPSLIVTPADNPEGSPALRSELLESMRKHGQQLPGFVTPSAELPDDQRLCIEGNNRLWCARELRKPFWAFDLNRCVDEAERIELTFRHNGIRRVMSRIELAAKAARYMELKGCTAAEAAKLLGVSAATLSRAFGEARIPAELKPRADQLGLSIRSIIAAAPAAVMARAIDYAQTPDPASGKLPTRDAVDLHIRQLKKDGGKEQKPKAVRLELEGRAITIFVTEGDVASDTAKELKAIASKLAGLGEMPPDGWPYHFD